MQTTNTNKYQHLYFDLDHTLWDFDKNAKVTLTEVYAVYELDKKVDALFDDFYQKYLFHNQVLWERYHKGFINAEDLKWKRMWRTLLDYKIADENLARDISGRFLEILPTQKEVFPHTFEILDYLTDKNYQLHLITNGFEITQHNKLRNSGLDKYFRHVITSEKSNSVKPRKEIFDYALHVAGADLSNSIMIGDNLDADIMGAMNAGMDSIFVNHINASTEIKPTYTITHLQQLEDIF
ncbi:MAG: noncanonical pyrimidine nucleotidase, YjjG family [Chitinophagaceae bacterium]|nr:MAG: noncanonical pyrimidine nucleotidase, YjjG family [Chitinophagaceae bacterium]